MRNRFLLPTLWLLSLLLPAPRLQAQGRPLGPWRVVVNLLRVKGRFGWGMEKTDTTTRLTSKKVISPARQDITTDTLPKGWDDVGWEVDTTTHLATETEFVPVPWDVAPDSIRLFLRCENPLIAPPRPHKGQAPVRFSATGATVRLDTKWRRLLIAPSAPMVTLWAHRGQTLLFKHQFQAVPPPLPTVEVHLYDPKRATWERIPPDSVLARFELLIRVMPAVAFGTIIPVDARYRIPRFQATILRGNARTGQRRTVNGSNILIPRDSLRIGDHLRIDVKQVQRMNFRGSVETIPMQKTLLYLKKEYWLQSVPN